MKDMRSQKLYNSITSIDDRFVEEAREAKKRKSPAWLKLCAVAACFCLIVTAVGVSFPYLFGKGSDAPTPVDPIPPVTQDGSGKDDETAPNTGETDDTDNNPAIGGGAYPCTIHDDYMHVWDDFFTLELMTQEDARAWFDYAHEKDLEIGNNDGCPYRYTTIKQFIDDNGFTREEVEAASENCRTFVHDIDLLFDGTDEEIEAYYMDTSSRYKSFVRQTQVLELYIYIQFANEESLKNSPRNLSIIELVKYYDLDRETLEGYIAERNKHWEERKDKEIPNFNLDLIYGGNGVEAITDEEIASLGRWELDSLFYGVDDLRTG